ncbi:LysR substrate-binding domain-containing protein [Aquabacterium humicola]|uniref:LysR substrate-binding domain-containing protein n=1 Tax=Aquabacterium humicola TaxID=3237377 RepID=UPI00254345A6|nr:LysR substrate-binding domain-containing protein [Rubrivivax pictus]
MEGLVHRSLRAFLVLAEEGSLAAAGNSLGRTPSALSLQISALEQRIGRRLFTRGARGMALSPAGEVLLRYAREMVAVEAAAHAAVRGLSVAGDVTFGMPQDFASSRLAATLQRFRRTHAGVRVHAVIERNNVIARQVSERALDLALLIGRRRHALAVTACARPTRWYAAPGLQWKGAAPLPLVMLEEPCIYRDDALKALQRAGVRHEIAFTTGSVPAMWAAVQAGTGVTARMDLGAARDVADAGARLGLPALPSTQLSLVRCRPSTVDAVEALAEQVRTSLNER